MTNYFCSTCGSLMYRKSERFPDQSILRTGTVDDFKLMETVLKPQLEVWTGKRVSWLGEVDTLVRFEEQPGGKAVDDLFEGTKAK
jgi:hypothetical protein